jgi:serine/threonine protein kinase/Tfp pilus assembly protein PilF
MNSVQTLAPQAPLSARSSLSLGLGARELASEIKNQWKRGEPADAGHAIARYPELRQEKSVILDLAYEEYCLHIEAGAPPDPDEFCERFPSFKASLRRLIDAHRFLAEHSYLLTDGKTVNWPVPGQEFMGFTLLRELGRGAFARVFLAAEPSLGNRKVAVKVSLQGTAEAETLGRINHRNIVAVHSVQEDATTGLSVVCMPYLGSATLCDVLDRVAMAPCLPKRADVILEAIREALPEEERTDSAAPVVVRQGSYVDGVIHIGAQLAEALACIHDLGICHRDLKPSNVLMSADGRPMILDFNLSFDENSSDNRLGGTLPYMSPEQLLATDLESGAGPSLIDARSDIFSLGMLLYEMLTGTHPFGPVPLKLSSRELRRFLLERQRRRPRPIRDINPDVDKSLARIVERCLSYNPNDRPGSPAELARLLRRCLSPLGKARRWYSRHPLALAASIVAVFALGTSAAVAAVNHEGSADRYSRLGREAFLARQYREAIGSLDKAIETQPTAELLFLRGRAYKNLNDIDAAVTDLTSSYKLEPRPQTAALLGFCHHLKLRHDQAAGWYYKAIEGGWDHAEVYNNLGLSYQRSRQLEEAKRFFSLAIARDPRLQSAYFNRALADHESKLGTFAMSSEARLGAAAQGAPVGPYTAFSSAAMLMAGYSDHIPRDAMRDIETAIQLGPTANLYFWQASIYAIASQRDPRFKEAMYQAMEHAIELGQPPRLFMGGFEHVKDEPRFREMLKRQPGPTQAVCVSPLVEPTIPDVVPFAG